MCLFVSNSISDTYVTGWLKTTAATGTAAMSSGITAANFYSALKYNTIPTAWWKGTFNTCCFYDSELAGNTAFEKTSTFLGLTTAQCKNVDYLQSIGFIVEGTD